MSCADARGRRLAFRPSAPLSRALLWVCVLYTGKLMAAASCCHRHELFSVIGFGIIVARRHQEYAAASDRGIDRARSVAHYRQLSARRRLRRIGCHLTFCGGVLIAHRSDSRVAAAIMCVRVTPIGIRLLLQSSARATGLSWSASCIAPPIASATYFGLLGLACTGRSKAPS